jgi:hypothetical protein
MKRIYDIYCDESCHLENDKMPIMLIGAVWCPDEKKNEIAQRIKDIKMTNGVPSNVEVKWTKASESKGRLYEDLINYFFDDDDLHFRCVVVKNKDKLNHAKFNSTHDEFYYKTYFLMLNNILSNIDVFNIYLDIKDTRSAAKVTELKNYLQNSKYDFSETMINRMQHIRSHESQVIQLTDILLGAMSYRLRELNKSDTKNRIISIIEKRANISWLLHTPVRQTKFNVFYQDLHEDNSDGQ